VTHRSFRRIFRLPLVSPWLHRWLFTPASVAKAVPAASLRAAAKDLSEVYCKPAGVPPGVPLALDGMEPKLALNWLLLPVSSVNGMTVGLVWTEVTKNSLDAAGIAPAPSGRFALDEAAGELFATAWRPADATLIVAWNASVLSCECVRETLHFDAPAPGTLPAHILTRMAFYERRHCRLCGPATGPGVVPDLSALPPPCVAYPAPHVTSPVDFSGFGFPTFRGTYFGTVVISRFSAAGSTVHGGGPLIGQDRRLICTRMRHCRPDRRRLLRLSLATGASTISWGLSP